MLQIAQIYETQRQLKNAENTLREALALQRQIGDKEGTCISLINLAMLFNNALGRPDDALPLLREALQIRRDAGNPGGEALVLNNIGSVYLTKGDFSNAQTYFERTLEMREKSKAPGDVADTLHNLGETLSRTGRYDQSLARYLRALELRRVSGDTRGAAIESYGIGTIFDYQGRYGAAIKSKAEALQALRDLKQRDAWLAEVLTGYGRSLSLGGRLDDALKPLDEAMTLAKELQNPSLIAQVLRHQADRLSYSGDATGASSLAQQALQATSRASDRRLTLEAQAGAARTAAGAKPSKALASNLAGLAQQAGALGLWALAVENSIHSAMTWLKVGDRASARKEAELALYKADTLGLRVLLAEAHYVLAEVLRLSGDSGAPLRYERALLLFDQIRSEDGNQDVLKRADLGAMHAECVRWSKGRIGTARVPSTVQEFGPVLRQSHDGPRGFRYALSTCSGGSRHARARVHSVEASRSTARQGSDPVEPRAGLVDRSRLMPTALQGNRPGLMLDARLDSNPLTNTDRTATFRNSSI